MSALDLDALEAKASAVIATRQALKTAELAAAAAEHDYQQWPMKHEAAAFAALDKRDDAFEAARDARIDLGEPEPHILALINRLRAAEAIRDDLRCEVESLQAERDAARVESGKLRQILRAGAWKP